MSKVAEEPIMALTKKPRTQDFCTEIKASGHFVQLYDHKKPWSLMQWPWHHIDSHCFKITLSEERVMGMNIVTTSSEDTRDRFHVFLYGSDPIHCTDRDGCGGIVQNGHILHWKCNCLLHIQCGPVCADVMVVHVDVKHAVDGFLHVENVVREMYHVEGDYDTNKPCWLPGSIADNYSTSWRQQAHEYSQDFMKLKLGYHKLQQQIVAQKQDMEQQHAAEMGTVQQELQRHKNAIEAIKQVVKCAFCLKMVPESFPCKMAACGHFLCAGCHEDYYAALGKSNSICLECRRNPGAKEDWQTVYCMTAVVAAINKIERQEVEQLD